MLPLEKMPADKRAGIKWILTDIDDTLTEEGKLGAEAYSALWALREAGIGVVPVTGRPAGWCDAIARQWPVDAVVGENGALVYFEDKGCLQRMYHPLAADPDKAQIRLQRLFKDVQAVVPRARLAKDQFSRMFDLALDFAEEAPLLGRQEIDDMCRVCDQAGAIAKVSSIHVNAWYGNYSKLGMSEMYLREQHAVDIYDEGAGVVYIGDSPNDCPMFAAVPLSVGVANVVDFQDQMDPLPMYVTGLRGGAGFAEFARLILDAKK
ncbi:MAG: HAD family phosphatase [Spirochaetaceae bacterium]|nr:MAG: HAD family phosphatase [Spirochaetaceae bacterium]